MVKNIKNKRSQKKEKKEAELEQARHEVDELLEVRQQAKADAESETKKIPVHIDAKIVIPKSAAREAVEISKNFSQIYKRDNSDSSMKTINRRDPAAKKKMMWWIMASLVVIAGAVLAGFYFFVNQEDQFTGENISIVLETTGGVSSGADTTISIVVTNDEEVALDDVELTLQFPGDYVFGVAVPRAVNDANNAWNIGTINPGKSKSITITGQFFGENRDTENIEVLLSYVPSNFSSVFQTDATLMLIISGSILELDLSAPTKSISDKEDRYSLTVTNTSSEDLEHVRVSIIIPDDLVVHGFSPESTSAIRYEWEFDMLAGGESVDISWRGTLSAKEGTTRELIASAGYVDADGQYVEQAETNAILFVVNPQLLVTVTQNESATGSPVMFGETLAYSITLENGSQSSIKNIVVTTTLVGEVLDWSGLADPQNGDLTGSTLRWDTASAAGLKELAPGDSTEITFNIPVLDSITATSAADGNYTVVASTTARSDEVTDLEGEELVVTAEDLTTLITSKVSLRTEARYYDDEYIPVGEGPLPPQVGEKTSYELYWYLQNISNEVIDVSVSAVLPTGVVWEEDSSVSAGTLAYDSSTRTITWSINKLPKHVGQYVPEVHAQFSLSIIPQTSDVGSLIIVMEKSIASATDSFTQRLISVTSDLVTTALPQDPQGIGKGEVVIAPPTNTNSGTNTNTGTNSNSNINSS